ncbi:hypothetical protein GCM10010441_37230 [Kitasatospora paracochleata]|uniref:Uncharacterized protein n=1 Tax=Kitasatospora paracochleata TaxID=58354 RepID=A0ABT1J768_9ACTN|nr:hypothetical protein [Kitasatospora paracochleata]MCP2313284.1 hypothetical protein [Kitasatospora paracochleata]
MSTDTAGPEAPEPALPPKPDPAATAQPALTAQPAETEQPAPTEQPAETEQPAPTEQPAETTATDPAVPGQAPAPDAESLPHDLPEAQDLLAVGAEDTVRPRRRLSTPRLLLAAVLLGPLVGAGVGYAIQAARPATPLPAIAAVKLGYPAERIDPAALAAAGPQPLNIDGDLRDLLVKVPDGAKDISEEDGHDHWMSAADMAETVGDGDQVFRLLLEKGFRRTAVVGWDSGGTKYRVQLIQYFPDHADNAISQAKDGPGANASLSKIPGNPDGTVTVFSKADHYAESTEEFWFGEAIARRGDVVMDIEVFAPSQVDKAQLEDLAKRQWERLA